MKTNSDIELKNTQLKHLQLSCQQYEADLDQTIYRLKQSFEMNQKMLIELNNLKEFIDRVKKHNLELSRENDHLKMTIGTNYYDLTPRPNWYNVREELGLSTVAIDGSVNILQSKENYD